MKKQLKLISEYLKSKISSLFKKEDKENKSLDDANDLIVEVVSDNKPSKNTSTKKTKKVKTEDKVEDKTESKPKRKYTRKKKTSDKSETISKKKTSAKKIKDSEKED